MDQFFLSSCLILAVSRESLPKILFIKKHDASAHSPQKRITVSCSTPFKSSVSTTPQGIKYHLFETMHRPHNSSHVFFFLFLFFILRARADVGTGALYGPPYLPTACSGGDPAQFPPNNLFAAAGEGIWDNGASCGREYLVRCLSSAAPGACAGDGPTIQVTVVDQAGGLVNSTPSAPGTTLVLSRTAFAMIANLSAAQINIEFTEV